MNYKKKEFACSDSSRWHHTTKTCDTVHTDTLQYMFNTKSPYGHTFYITNTNERNIRTSVNKL